MLLPCPGVEVRLLRAGIWTGVQVNTEPPPLMTGAVPMTAGPPFTLYLMGVGAVGSYVSPELPIFSVTIILDIVAPEYGFEMMVVT
jgi:hypothetical protein